ncbi:universal stress protein [Nonomuraea sp. NPDC005983]|uniref:universal stress protein n=1 Tax=Nonomuraea sp. NPDC005983 TaxID=3155595 RepID=UPI0033BA7C00
MNRVVVGYDGSDFSMQALDWAMDEAEYRKLPLTVAHAWQWPYGEADDEAKAHLRKAAEHVLWHGAECARSTSSVVDVETDLFEGSAARRLVSLSDGAALVVVGSRGLSTLPRAVMGSVAEYVAAHAGCPVIVVRGPGPLPAPTRPGPVVVVDREPSEAVLEFAFDEAAIRQLAVVAAGDLAAWRAGHPDVEVKAAPDPGRPATLMVVGRGENGHLGGAETVLQHAPCPVAVLGSHPARA